MQITRNLEETQIEVVAGIKEYLNVMLGTQLLYKFERPEYAEILAEHPDAPMYQGYGAPHLRRLFVQIGAMLAYTTLDEKNLSLLLNYLHGFLKHLAKTLQLCLVPVIMKWPLLNIIGKQCEEVLFAHLCLDLCKDTFVLSPSLIQMMYFEDVSV
ncbi:Mortality factor 4-like protein 1 [Sciurus carolinensis]|uniref:Mortality factor 4-like protein 1 n=1 Tax=Sciurus carolinensis TaxID=30640 RepID=A0AA41MQZ2_SCICA|nr:Mortality factor 4-like protein 1 [Sciurus carolinensis]